MRNFSGMNLDVDVKIGLLSKLFVTKVTLERAILEMNSLDMDVQWTLTTK